MTAAASEPAPATSRSGALAERAVAWLAAALGAAALLTVATVPMSPSAQAAFGGLTAVAFLIANLFPGRRVTTALIALSLFVSVRYLAWRFTETLPSDTTVAVLLGGGLLLAELYAFVVLALGYLQTAWPLRRTIKPLPPDPATWPSVDVYVPTYNEPMEVVRPTLLAAMSLDWPPDRLRVWLLDDGHRDEFRRFADRIGCDYLARPDNRHAKAGNLNHALRATDGAFVAIFDCDHVPTRAFLQLTMGWLVAEPNLALVQTPQHFHSPDPFQRNLASGARVPAEGHLFHGLIQDGHDTWNAAFCSGTGAVLRREALLDVGGFATDTVTEDAHTTLRLHRRAWDSAYLRLPLAAGLATDRLSRHVAQRARWARGMLQIVRLDNPLFGRGLSWMQRLCYLQAAGHFLFALPRVVFLTAPLAFLLLGQSVIAARPLAVAAYALPHFFHAVATSSRLHGRWRHAFWSEIYETVLALLLVRVTLAALLLPRRGAFGVTAKGGSPQPGGFDLRATVPNLILAALLLAALLRGIGGLLLFDQPPLAFQALAMNSIWAALSLLTVLAALAVGREGRRRSRAGVRTALPVTLRLPDGTEIDATAVAVSQEGGVLAVPDAGAVPADAEVHAVFALAGEPVALPAHVLRADAAGVRLQWEPRTLEQEADMVRVVFGRADAWSGWADDPVDRPLVSLWRILVSVGGLFRPRQQTRAAMLGLALLLAAAPAMAQTQRSPAAPRTTTVRPMPGGGVLPNVTIPLAKPTSAPGTSAPGTSAPGTSAPGGLPAEPVPPPPAPVAAAPAPTTPAAPALPPNSVRQVVLNLRQLGAPGALALTGTATLQNVEFGLRSDEVVTAAQLSLSGAMSPSLLPEFSNVTVTLNEQYVGSIPATRDRPNFTADFPVNPIFFQDANRLTFHFSGRYTPDCNDPLSGLLWASVADSSTLTLTLQRLPPQRDLARLPMPFFDPAVRQPLLLPVVLPANPGNDALRAAAIASSWFGTQTGDRGASFTVSADPPAQGNALMILTGGDGARVGLPPLTGPTLAVVANPSDPLASILVIAGRSGDEAVAAATALAVGSRAMAGPSASVLAPILPPRAPYDAPNWIPVNRPVKFGELVEAADLQSYGYAGRLHVPFRTAPDLYTWRDAPFPLRVRFRAPPGPIVDVAASRLDIAFNGSYLGTAPLAGGQDSIWSGLLGRQERAERVLSVPSYAVSGANDVQFAFDARPLHRGDCTAVPGDLRMSVDPDSTIDLSRAHRFAELPNLAFFLNSGFPFTRMADLSETAVVLPDRPSAAETGVFLDLMGRIGAQTGAAATRVTVVRPDSLNLVADRDLLLLGTLPNLGTAESLLARAPVRVEGGRLALALPTSLDTVRRLFGDPAGPDRQRVAAELSENLGPGTALLTGGESPLEPGRSVLALLAEEPAGLAGALDTLRAADQAPLVQGDLALLTGGRVSSYRVGHRYAVGSLPFWVWPSWALRDQPLGLAALALIGAALLGSALFLTLRRRAAARTPGRLPPRREDGR